MANSNFQHNRGRGSKTTNQLFHYQFQQQVLYPYPQMYSSYNPLFLHSPANHNTNMTLLQPYMSSQSFTLGDSGAVFYPQSQQNSFSTLNQATVRNSCTSQQTVSNTKREKKLARVFDSEGNQVDLLKELNKSLVAISEVSSSDNVSKHLEVAFPLEGDSYLQSGGSLKHESLICEPTNGSTKKKSKCQDKCINLRE